LGIILPFEHWREDRDEYAGRRRQRVKIKGWKSSPAAACRKPPESENLNGSQREPSKENG
jgi:hypothetical protein